MSAYVNRRTADFLVANSGYTLEEMGLTVYDRGYFQGTGNWIDVFGDGSYMFPEANWETYIPDFRIIIAGVSPTIKTVEEFLEGI